MLKILNIFMAAMLLFVIGCAAIPTGVDPIEFRLREAELNLNTVEAVLPAAGYTAADEADLRKMITEGRVLIDQVRVAAVGGFEVDVDAGLNALQLIVDNLGDDKARRDGNRIIATLRLANQLIENNRILKEEFQ